METTQAAAGRRARNMRDKRERIFQAAAELFAAKGFGEVSTQEVSERADVASGTLFRYASSKAELLLMVFNEEFRRALELGRERAAEEPDAAGAVVQMVLPVVEAVAADPENSVVYQRELLFGAAGEHYRNQGLLLVAELEERIASRLMTEAEEHGLVPDSDRARLAGSTVFAVMLMAVSRSSTGAHAGRDVVADLSTQVAQAAAGYLAALSPHEFSSKE